MNPIHSIRFVNTFPGLPAAAPSDHAHIISRGSYNFNGDSVNTDIQIQDAIATTLHSVSASVLQEFLGSAETVRIKFESKSPPGNRVVVMRKGSEVVVGQYTVSASPPAPPEIWFMKIVRLSINSDRGWKITYAANRDTYLKDWDDVWAGRTIDSDSSITPHRATTNEDPTMTIIARSLADYLILDRLWVTSEWRRTITVG